MTNRATKGGPGRLAAGLAALLALGLAGPAQAGEMAGETGVPMIVKIHADWCGTCTRMNPTFEALRRQVGGEARIVVLDVTNRDAVAKSSAEADRLGIRGFFDEYKGKTGTVGVLDAEGRAVDVLEGETDVAVYRAALARVRSGSPS